MMRMVQLQLIPVQTFSCPFHLIIQSSESRPLTLNFLQLPARPIGTKLVSPFTTFLSVDNSHHFLYNLLTMTSWIPLYSDQLNHKVLKL